MTHELVLGNGLVVAPGGVFHGGRVVTENREIVENRPGGRFVPQVARPRGTP